jgi:HK97 family phage major capsid protein
MSAMADISRQDLEDVAVSLDQLVLEDFTEQFGVSEGSAFVSGDGVDGKPEGILTASDQGYLGANGIQSVVTANSGTMNGDDLIELFYTLKDAYARKATWLMKRGTVKVVRQLKETSTDNYLWQPGLASVAPPRSSTGRTSKPSTCPARPSGTTFNVGDLPIAFGDFKPRLLDRRPARDPDAPRPVHPGGQRLHPLLGPQARRRPGRAPRRDQAAPGEGLGDETRAQLERVNPA